MSSLFRLLLSLSLAVLAAAVAGCSKAADEGEATDKVPVAFAVAVDTKLDAESRADAITGEITTDNIQSMGVFAYYTGASNFDGSFGANFMNDQEISRTGTQPWTYSPVKYWPNTAGEKITFFAYSPHSSHFTEKDPAPIPLPFYYLPGGTFEIMLNNPPALEYAPRLQAEKQTDVLIARSLMNCTKQKSKLTFQFDHLLTKVVFKVRSTEKVCIDRINISGMTTYGYLYSEADGTYLWDERGIESEKIFYSLPNKDVPANATTAVSTFFMIPYYYETMESLLDVYYTNADGTKEEKIGIPFGYIATDSGDAVDYTIVIDGEAEISVTNTGIGSDWPATPEDVGHEDVAAG